MGYTLKLDIYYFSLRKIEKETQRKVKDAVRTFYITKKEDCIFSEFVNSLSFDKVNKDDYTKVILEDFIKGFNASFKSNKNNTQAISTTSEQYRGFDSKDYTFWGVFKGGTTGISREVYESDNAIEPTSTIDESKVATLYYYYKIWLPLDSNVGILMVQSYTSVGCTSLFKEQLENYFIRKGYKISSWSKCIPKEYIEKYLKDGYINEIHVIHRKRDIEKPLNPVFGAFMFAKRREIFNRFNIFFKDFISVVNYKSVLQSQIKAISTDFDEEQDVVKLFYVNSKGQSANATLANIEDILPTITLDDSLKDENTQQPKWDELHLFTKDLLYDIKKQISYTPNLIV